MNPDPLYRELKRLSHFAESLLAEKSDATLQEQLKNYIRLLEEHANAVNKGINSKSRLQEIETALDFFQEELWRIEAALAKFA